MDPRRMQIIIVSRVILTEKKKKIIAIINYLVGLLFYRPPSHEYPLISNILPFVYRTSSLHYMFVIRVGKIGGDAHYVVRFIFQHSLLDIKFCARPTIGVS